MSIVDVFRLDEKVALIPGGSGGIGSELARGLARAGAKVTIVGRSKERAEEAAQKVEDAGSEALIVVGDMTIEQDAERCVNETLDRFGRWTSWSMPSGRSRQGSASRPRVSPPRLGLDIRAQPAQHAAAHPAARAMIYAGRGGRVLKPSWSPGSR
jgi:NAD(P)-dependent dehydrogenase (short-subunit alcohol dehydrogenase family)